MQSSFLHLEKLQGSAFNEFSMVGNVNLLANRGDL